MSIQFIINEKINLNNKILITGFHGIGTTGFIAIKYIIDQMDAKKIGTIISDNIPPFITTKDGKISLPFELYAKDDYIFLIPQFQPYRHEHRTFAEEIVNWSIQSKFRYSILIGGLDGRLKKNDLDKLRIISTSEYLKNYSENNLTILEDGLFVTGPLALLLTYYEISNFPAIAILPYAESSRADPLAAANAINAINILTNLNINTKKLVQDAEQIEKNLQDLITQTKEQPEEEKELGSKRLYI